MNAIVAETFPSNMGTDLVFEDRGGYIHSITQTAVGEVWTEEEIMRVKENLLSHGREWLVVDNLVVHESIKLGALDADKFIWNYQQTLINLSSCGIKVVCYNFMPIFYKIRTHVSPAFANSNLFSLFDTVAFIAFDLYILKRPNAEKSYNQYQRHMARIFNHKLSEDERFVLVKNIRNCVQSGDAPSLNYLRKSIQQYYAVSNEHLQNNFRAFNKEILPLAKSLNIRMHFTSDDPGSGLMGLPSVC
jgi:mannonate dehydratase